ncbi:hypothetical protein BD779DRAFT_1803328 [Infundibulicybe gibba]|nr:hypothetical protein BD779DRAFT_1803328 [Infundibulicybe gibba]
MLKLNVTLFALPALALASLVPRDSHTVLLPLHGVENSTRARDHLCFDFKGCCPPGPIVMDPVKRRVLPNGEICVGGGGPPPPPQIHTITSTIQASPSSPLTYTTIDAPPPPPPPPFPIPDTISTSPVGGTTFTEAAVTATPIQTISATSSAKTSTIAAPSGGSFGIGPGTSGPSSGGTGSGSGSGGSGGTNGNITNGTAPKRGRVVIMLFALAASLFAL